MEQSICIAPAWTREGQSFGWLYQLRLGRKYSNAVWMSWVKPRCAAAGRKPVTDNGYWDMNMSPQVLWGLKSALIIKLTLAQEIKQRDFLKLPSVSCLGKCEPSTVQSFFQLCFSNFCCTPVVGNLKLSQTPRGPHRASSVVSILTKSRQAFTHQWMNYLEFNMCSFTHISKSFSDYNVAMTPVLKSKCTEAAW